MLAKKLRSDISRSAKRLSHKAQERGGRVDQTERHCGVLLYGESAYSMTPSISISAISSSITSSIREENVIDWFDAELLPATCSIIHDSEDETMSSISMWVQWPSQRIRAICLIHWASAFFSHWLHSLSLTATNLGLAFARLAYWIVRKCIFGFVFGLS